MLKFFQRRNKDPREELRRVLGDYQLPSFSGVLLSALQEIRKPEASPGAVAEILAADPGMSVEVLRTVNSAAFALRRRIAAVEDAVALLGLKTLETLVLSFAVRESLPTEDRPGFSHSRFWHAAARRASTARALARMLNPGKEMESFTAALLQDMAIPFLVVRDPKKYGAVLEEWHEGGGDLAELERRSFDWDHAEVASWIAHGWEFPEELIVSIGTHHRSLESDTETLPTAAMVAVLRENEENLGEEEFIERVSQSSELSHDEIVILMDQSFADATEVAATFT